MIRRRVHLCNSKADQMPLSVALTHRTTYHYDRAVSLGPQTIRLRPAPHARTPILSYALRVEPRPHFINWQQDPQGNHLARVVFPDRVSHFDVTVDLVADMATINPFDFFMEPDAEQWPFSYDPLLEQELAPFRRLLPVGPRLQELLDQVATRRAGDRGHAGRAQPHGAEPRQLHCPHGARRVDAGRDAGGWRRLVPGFSLAAGAVAAPTRLCRTLRLRLSDPARRRREAAGRTGRPDLRLHRPARLGRGLSAWRRLGGPGRHFRSANRRGPYPARRDARSTVGRADHRTGGTMQDGIRLRNARDAACARRHGLPSRTARRSGRTSSRWVPRWIARLPPAMCD